MKLILNISKNLWLNRQNEDEDDYDGFTFVATSYKELKDMGKDEKDDI